MKIFRILLITSLTLLYSICASSQTRVLDSLLNKLKNPVSDTEKIQILNDISSEYIENDPAKMMQYAKKALVLSQQKKLKKQEANSWFNIGNANIMLSHYTEALKSYSNSQTVFEELLKTVPEKEINDIKDRLAITYGSIGVVCSEQNNYAKALEYYFKALKLHDETKEEVYMAHTYNNIGIVYKSQKEYNKALEYYNKALWLQKKLGDDTAAITITNIGAVYLLNNESDKAYASFKEAEKILTSFKNKRGLAELYNNFGNYYVKTGDYAKAEKSYLEALKIFEETGEKYGASASLGYLGTVYATQHKNKEALNYLMRSSSMADEIGVMEQVRESEKALSDLYEKSGKTAEALNHYKKYIAAKENINTAESIKSMVREEMNYEFERKEALQKLENEKRQLMFDEQAKRHRQQMLFAALFTVLLFGLAFLIYNRLQLKKTLTLQRDLAEYEQKALHLQMNPHFVFNCLGSISSFIVQNGTDSAIKYLSKFSKLMRLTLEYSKESLIPIDKEIEGLQNYLELEQLRFNKVFDFSISKDPSIEDDMAIPPLLLQPFVENAIIHGLVPKKKKGFISVDFVLEKDKLVCTITDDGIGYNRSKKLKENSVTVHKSMALEITKKRLEVIQAFTSKTSQVEIKELTDANGEPAGTKIILNLPIQYSSD
ncbi:tetratricopeptide repeat protein [Flavobacterium sp. NRK1]|uniref:tetratricopeptide repeat-containing sensor histidine kinase n=1 Tax=Flavobacterium sp. NRK1 TaxID=2954929 RepID=UPI0020928FA8|nr:tetratricopeptide repeat protein [Flavobacterium sp. NRK1]MCO6146919.1 tetratricopeptide repeat protein [Flavobacterium sp. NRK1]